jgi:hypothetical protein
MKTILSLSFLLLASSVSAKVQFNADKANSEKEEFVQQLKAVHREQVIKDFEHHMRHFQKKLQLSLKFLDDLEGMMGNKELSNKRDFNNLLKDYRNKLKDFEKTMKRRDKFFEKDLVKPSKKDFDKRLKSLLSEIRTQSRSWR